MKGYQRKDRVIKTPLNQVKMGGYINKLMMTFFNERIFSDYAEKVVYRECEDAFINRKDDSLEPNIGYWQGEFWGKWIISAARAVRYTGNERTRAFVHQGARNLLALQREDGYLGTYQNSADVMAPAPEQTNGRPCWNWNIWCRKYTLWGMLEAYELTCDEDLLQCAVRMADHLMRELAKTGHHIAETGTFNGLPSCSILKPMLILYRHTEDERYLRFCLSIAERWTHAEQRTALIANALAGKPISAWYPESNKWAKAYEMMSCYDGLLELYRVTGDALYLNATEAFFDILMQHERNLLYSVAFNDQFGDGAYDINCITEPCDVLHFMRLCHELFVLTGHMKYMDAFEEVFYNAFLASAFQDGKWGARGVRGAGRHLVATMQAYFTKNHCCVNNLPRGFLNMVETCVMHDTESVVITLYSEAEVALCIDGHTVKVKIDGDYAADSAAKITVDFGTSPLRKIKLRIPAWTSMAAVTVDGAVYHPQAGEFTVTAAHPHTELAVAFDNRVKVRCVKGDPERGDLPWKYGRFINKGTPMGEVPDDVFVRGPRCVLRKGVVLLCRSKVIGNTEAEMFGDTTLLSPQAECTLTRVPSNGETDQLYDLQIKDGDKVRTVRVCDFASGVNRMFEDAHSFSVYF